MDSQEYVLRMMWSGNVNLTSFWMMVQGVIYITWSRAGPAGCQHTCLEQLITDFGVCGKTAHPSRTDKERDRESVGDVREDESNIVEESNDVQEMLWRFIVALQPQIW